MGDFDAQQIMVKLGEIHGDVRVALDRTATHSASIDDLYSKHNAHANELAETRGRTKTYAAMAALFGGSIGWILTRVFH